MEDINRFIEMCVKRLGMREIKVVKKHIIFIRKL
jgi:hypothetical protein